MATEFSKVNLDYNVPCNDGRMLYQFDPKGRHLRTLNALTGAVMLRFEYNAQGQLTAQIDGDGDALGITRTASAVRLTAPDGQVTEIVLNPDGFASSVATLATDQQWQLRYNAPNTGLLASFQRPNGHPPSTYTYLNGVLFRDRNARGGGFDFQHFRAANGSDYRQTRIRRVEGGDRSIEKFRSNLLGYSRQTLPDGSSLTTSASGALAQFGRSPQEMLTTSLQQPGALFGLAATFSASASSKTPAGVGFVRTNAQNATVPIGAQLGGVNLQMSSNVSDLKGDSARLKLANYNAAKRTWSYTTAESRTSTAQIDAQGRPLSTQFADLAPVVYEYDARGRVKKLTQGSGIEARVTDLEYDAFGFVRLIKDPLQRELVLTNDAIGRTTKMRLPDLREVEFDFDANNNITGVKPPMRDWHRFRYDTTDKLAGYDPPNLAGISAPATDYGYNLHPRLTSITRPDARNIMLTQDPGAVGPEPCPMRYEPELAMQFHPSMSLKVGSAG